MSCRDEAKAINYIEKDMVDHNIQQCSIARFGGHIIYYSINKENLSCIIKKKINVFMGKNRKITDMYGAIDNNDALDYVTDFILNISCNEKGIRHGLLNLYNCLNTPPLRMLSEN